MTRRATLRGAERTAIEQRDADVLVCGASFAGLAVARELRGSGADVLLVDRYEIGERQTSACAAPLPWLEALGLTAAVRQEIPCMSFHTPHGSVRYRLPWSWAAFDYRELCELMFEACDARFEIAKVAGRRGDSVLTDRGELNAPLVVDALGWRRVLASDGNQPPEAPLSRGLEVHPDGGGDDLDVWIERSLVRRGYGWSVLAGGEQWVGVGSYKPRDHVKQPTIALAGRLGRPCATRAIGFPTACAGQRRTASSSSATPPGTASPCPARASAPPCTSGSPAAASWAPWWLAAAPATKRCAATRPSAPATRAPSGWPCAYRA